MLTEQFLGMARFQVWSIVNECEFAPASILSEDSAAEGDDVLQLASRQSHSTPPMTAVRNFVASKVYDFISLAFALPRSEELVVQLFPVRMRGRRDSPPAQRPHRDGYLLSPGQYIYPIVTAVYFLDCHEMKGGELILYDGLNRLSVRETRFIIRPTADLLVVMSGDIYHCVTPLINGVRASIVVNFYECPVIGDLKHKSVTPFGEWT